MIALDLVKRPSHCRETAKHLHQLKATSAIPLVFVDGKLDDIEKTRVMIPNGIFIESSELFQILEEFKR